MKRSEDMPPRTAQEQDDEQERDFEAERKEIQELIARQPEASREYLRGRFVVR